ncbi:MAG: DNA gyrase inhibitor YacG [Deltaproteobacteria bacterium]|nr:DNA gyrase inhibitor YacG [Deltaproteobacteria bacterium]
MIVTCPTCKKKVEWEKSSFRPFCSERCRLLDLGDWANEKFRIPGEKVDPENLPKDNETPDTTKKNKD